ncbi:conserved hypothetical protein [Mesorhizobium plurifarium]|uniref:AAA+ ATPase domain-containing protein n=1 Tax=Mesorhizobium plurifarium TaxID=69974 RepID=A0A090DTT0_MESPL|nr:conserved hypothetical protein [Mesorhizobium plurifarium]
MANRQALQSFMSYSSERISQSVTPRAFLSLEEPSVQNALHRLFHGKCAFCESKDTIKPYRFRPPAEAEPFQSAIDGHLYYAWLVDAWDNIYSICDNCHPLRRGRSKFFPVKGRRARIPAHSEIAKFVEESTGLWPFYPPHEKPLLVEPCEQKDFTQFFHVELSGKLVAKSERAATTIETFDLNREDLIKRREAAFAERLAALEAAIGRSSGKDLFQDQVDLITAFADLEFGGTWFLLLRRLCMAVGSGGGPLPALSMQRIRRFLYRLRARSDAMLRLSSAIEATGEADKIGLDAEFASTVRRTGTMRVQSVSLRNFKALEELDFTMPEPMHPAGRPTDAAPAPSILILGENAAGKSSILEAIALALSDEAARDELALDATDFVLKPQYMGAPSLSSPGTSSVVLTFEDGSILTMTAAGSGFDVVLPFAASQLPPVFAYGAFRHYLRKQRNHSPAKYIQNLMRSDEVLSNPEKWLLGLDDAVFAMVVRQLRYVLSIEGEFEVIRRNREDGRCYIVTAIVSPDGNVRYALTPFEVASSGFRTVLAMVCDIFQGILDPRVNGTVDNLAQASGVVLIDEVEAHLHPRWKMNIMRGLRQALPNMTFIATTHDPLCLRGMGDKEVMVLQRSSREADEGIGILPVFVEKMQHLPATSQLTVEQILTSDFFQLYSADAPELEGQFARIADILGKRNRGEVLNAVDRQTLQVFESDIASAMPVGTSEVHRLVQEAVALFLQERRKASDDHLQIIRENSKQEILAILRGAGT